MQTFPLSDLKDMISSMEPVLNEGVYVYTSVPHGSDTSMMSPIATVREIEGITVIIPESEALELGLPMLFRCAWITLHVHSDLNAFGLTAAFAKTLSEEEISCNVVAGAFHDHIFVPNDLASQALAALKRLQGTYKEISLGADELPIQSGHIQETADRSKASGERGL